MLQGDIMDVLAIFGHDLQNANDAMYRDKQSRCLRFADLFVQQGDCSWHSWHASSVLGLLLFLLMCHAFFFLFFVFCEACPRKEKACRK